MRILNLDYQIGKYDVKTNNCIDYIIAGACGFFNVEFFDLYCAFWSLYSNYYYDYSISYIRVQILKNLGLEIVESCVNSFGELINKIDECIRLEKPVLIYVPSSTLYYAENYMNLKDKIINHAFIVNGIDLELKIVYIREITINNELLNILTTSQPFSEYKLTFAMFEEIYNLCVKTVGGEIIAKRIMQFIELKEKVDIVSLKIQFKNEAIDLFLNKDDLLENEIINSIKKNYLDEVYNNEQFRRTTIYSVQSLFDQMNYLLKENCVATIKKIEDAELLYREKLVNYLSLKALRKAKLDSEKLLLHHFKLRNMDENIATLFKKELLDTNRGVREMIKCSTNVKCTADSEISKGHKVFCAENVLKDAHTNAHLCFWCSNNLTTKHWIMIEFSDKIEINLIRITHYHNPRYVTKKFSAFISDDGIIWKLVLKSCNNNSIITDIKLKKPKKIKFFKINIYEPNYIDDKTARITNIRFLKIT